MVEVLGSSPRRDLAVVHVGRHDDSKLAFAPLRDRETGIEGLQGLQDEEDPAL